MKLNVMEVIESSTARIRQQGNADYFTSVTTDSRHVKAGALFCALSGEHFDGHKFVSTAFRKGASGALVRKGKSIKAPRGRWVLSVDDTLTALGDIAAAWRRHFNIPLVGVTGSNGKTTTKEMIAQTLAARYKVLKTEGNYNNLIGVPWTLFKLNRRHQVAVLEMGMNIPGEIERLATIAQPQVGVITNIARAHLEGLGSIAAIARAKSELIQQLPGDGLAVINADDPRVLQIARKTRAEILTYGFGSDAMIRGKKYKSNGFSGSQFEIRLNHKLHTIRLNLPGRYNALNALAAVAIGQYLKIPATAMIRALRNVKLPGSRLKQIKLRNGTHIINDCYNANPDSVLQALTNLTYAPKRQRRVAILGDMLELGQHSARTHREIGRAAVKVGVDELIAVGEQADDIARGARQAGLHKDQIHCYENATKAGKAISKHIHGGDLILVKGSRGVQLERVIDSLKGKRVR